MQQRDLIKIRTKAVKDGRKSIYLDLYFKGKRKYEFLGMYFVPEQSRKDRERNKQTLTFVDMIRAKRVVEFYNGEYDIAGKNENRINLRDYIEYFQDLKRSEGKEGSAKLIEQLKYHMESFCRKREVPIRSVDPRFLEDFKTYLRNAKSGNRAGKLSATTQSNIFGCLKNCFRNAIKEGLVKDNPFVVVSSPRKNEKSKEYLTLDELKTLIATPCKYPGVKEPFLFSCFTGLRISDITNLVWGNIHTTDEGEMQLQFDQKKTKKETFVPLSRNAVMFLPDRAADAQETDRVFAVARSSTVNIRLAKWVAAAGITKHISFHCSRHTCATLHINYGVDVFTVKELLGHSDIQMTMKYVRSVDKNKRLAVNKIPSVQVTA